MTWRILAGRLLPPCLLAISSLAVGETHILCHSGDYRFGFTAPKADQLDIELTTWIVGEEAETHFGKIRHQSSEKDLLAEFGTQPGYAANGNAFLLIYTAALEQGVLVAKAPRASNGHAATASCYQHKEPNGK